MCHEHLPPPHRRPNRRPSDARLPVRRGSRRDPGGCAEHGEDLGNGELVLPLDGPGRGVEATIRYRGARPADCNANALLDVCEIQKGYSADANHNGVVDECESLVLPCPSDINRSGETNGADLGILLASWGNQPQPGIDLDGDGAVNGADLGILLAGWGPCVN